MDPERSWRFSLPPGFFSRSIVRILTAAVIIAAGFGLLTAYFFRSISQRMLDLRKQELVRIVDLGMAAIEPFRDSLLTEDNYMSVEQVRRNAAVTLRDLTYRYQLGDNYLFMITYDGLVLVNPFSRKEEFTDQLDRQDVEGVYYINEMVSAAQSPEGGGFVEYRSPRPGMQDPERTIAYVTAVPEWDVFIGAGIYLGDMERENSTFFLLSLLLILLLVVTVMVIVHRTLRPTLRSYRVLGSLFDEISRNPDSYPDVPLDRFQEGSEAWHLLSGFRKMQDRKLEYKQAFEQAALAERTRLARDLHDAVSQTLFSAGLIADVLPALQEQQPEAAAEQAHLLSDLVHGAHAELRTLLVELRPDSLVKADLTELLQQLADAVQGRFRIRIQCSLEEPGPISLDGKIAFYRIAQEALHNTAKHSGAETAWLSLERIGQQDRIEMRITDNGRGFDMATTGSGHFGLESMAARAQEVGADFALNSNPGSGTQIIVSWRDGNGGN